MRSLCVATSKPATRACPPVGDSKPVKDCPSGTVWSDAKKKCVYSSSGIVPDSEMIQQGRSLALAGRYDDAIQVLQNGQKAAPKDEEIPALLGQIYSQQAQAAKGEKQKELQKKTTMSKAKQ